LVAAQQSGLIHFVHRLASWQRMTRRIALGPQTLIAIAFDMLVAGGAWALAFIARYQFSMAPEQLSILLATLPVVVAIELACFVYFGLYRGIWRYASMYDVKRIVTAVGVAALIVPVVLLLWRHGLGVPRVLYFINPLMLILFMGGGRIVYRWWKEHRQFSELKRQGRPVLLMGAGDGARRLLLELERSPSWQVVGLLDDNPAKVGRDIAGCTVMGTWEQVLGIARRTDCRHVIFATPGASQEARRRAFDLCEKAGLDLMVVPDLDQLIGSPRKLSEIRHIELDDLLGRDEVQLDSSGLTRQLNGKIVMITGAGGSIGSELCRQIARFSPQAMVLFELNEYALYQASEDLQRLYPEIRIWPIVGDVKDRRRLQEVFERFQPTVVFHAAAYKHVPMLEELNSWEAVRNNTLGTRVLAEVAAAGGIERFVFVSTDKAVNPTNVMGASKRLAELLLQRIHLRSGLPVVMVRFGNVLGSSGSVIPKFREQIARGGPITVTHPDITRYFMSITEAAQLVLQAGQMGAGNEIFVMDMGQPMRIADLARDMIRLSGFSENDIGIRYTGLRPGEKLYEELLAGDETTLPTRHAKLRISKALEPVSAEWEAQVLDWLGSEGSGSDSQVRGWLRSFVPEYAPPADLEVVDPSTALLASGSDSASSVVGAIEPVRLVLVAGGGEQPVSARGNISGQS
jgi:FlaA1/EpsC-like NDP-sugar epimerase